MQGRRGWSIRLLWVACAVLAVLCIDPGALRAASDDTSKRAAPTDDASEATDSTDETSDSPESTDEAGHDPYDDPALDEEVPTPEGEPIDEARTAPDYNGRSDDDSTIGETLIWFPRLVFAPLYLVLEYGVRYPIGWTTTAFERRGYINPSVLGVEETEGSPHFSAVPILSFESFRAPTLGLEFIQSGLFDDRLDMSFGAAGFPTRNLLVRGRFRRRFPRQGLALSMGFTHELRDDESFWGLTPRISTQSARYFTRYDTEMNLGLEASADEGRFTSHLEVGLDHELIRCSTDFERDVCGPDGRPNTADDRYPDGSRHIAPLVEDYTLARVGTRLYWDSRSPPHVGGGTRLELTGEWASGIGPGTPGIHLLSYGAEWSGFWEMFGFDGHTLGLRLRGEFMEPLGGSRVPVTKLPELGGLETMRGFQEGQFRGLSTALGTLEYRYPVWSYFNGVLFTEVGNAFGRRLRGFDPALLRATFGLGVRSFGYFSGHTAIDMNIAVGTTPFGEEFGLDAFQINVGTNWGF